jgi:hypothetical protein
MLKTILAPTRTVLTLFEANPIRSGVYIESTLAKEPDERHSELLRAEMAHTMDTPAVRHFWRISKLLRPLTITT